MLSTIMFVYVKLSKLITINEPKKEDADTEMYSRITFSRHQQIKQFLQM